MNSGGSPESAAHTVMLTALAMLSFAANSLLCRIALAPGLIDAASFAGVRVASAAATLAAVVWIRRQHLPRLKFASLRSVAALFTYLAFFTLAYDRLNAGTGALILFGAVQLTMFAVALSEGEHFPLLSWGGLAMAVAGLVILVLPGVRAPDPVGAVFMALSGAAWGFFSLLARGVENPVEANATNFLFCIPLAALMMLGLPSDVSTTPQGLMLAIASGAIASGLGYVIWYLALRRLPATRAATVQLSVPAIAALGGATFLSEPITARLLVASGLMLGGIAVVLSRPRAPARSN